MNRTDRLLAIVLELEARRYTRAGALAERFEVSVRTIYRDALALCEAGVPVVSTPGFGYSLMPGYFLPPLMLTRDEAGMLLLGAAFVAEHVDAPYKQAVETARKKIEKLLPETTRQEVDFLQDSLRFASRPRSHDGRNEALLTTIRRAIMERQVLHMAYHARHGEPGERDVEPHGLICMEGLWMMAAYCRTRDGMRHFRLDRIDHVAPLGERFTRRQDYTVRHTSPMVYGPDEVHALFTVDAIRWARENRAYGFVREEPHPAGVVMVFRPRDTRDLIPWLLSWGSAVQVISPPEVRRQLGTIVRALADVYAVSHDERAGQGPEEASAESSHVAAAHDERAGQKPEEASEELSLVTASHGRS